MSDYSQWPAPKLRAAIDKADRAGRELLNEMIEAGRGHETPRETINKTDDLSRRFNAARALEQSLNFELRARREYHGKDTPIKRKDNPIMATKKPTAKQLAARKEFARIMKSGGFGASKSVRKNPAQKTTTLEVDRGEFGAIKLQSRGGKFDVLRNSSGNAWMYIEKGVSETKARDVFERRRSEVHGPVRKNPARKSAPRKTARNPLAHTRIAPPKGYSVCVQNRLGEKGAEVAHFYTKAVAVDFARHYADKHKRPVMILGKGL